MKRYVGGTPRLSLEQEEHIADNRPAVDMILEILDTCVERQESALLSAQMEQEADLMPLAIKRARLEGAMLLVHDAKAALAKTSRS